MGNNRWLILPFIVGIIVLGWYAETQLKYDFSVSTFTAKNSPEYKNYKEYSDQFISKDQFITIGLDLDKPFNDWETFQRFLAFNASVKKLKGVIKVNSIAETVLSHKGIFGKVNVPLLTWKNEKTFQKKFKRLGHYQDIRPKFIAANDKAVRLYVQTDTLDVNTSSTLAREIELAAKKNGFSSIHLVGKGTFKAFAEKQFFYEMILLSVVGIILLIGLFYFFFRSLRSVLLSFTMLTFTIACTMILFWLGGVNVGILTLTVPLLIVVLSFCDIVHILYSYKKRATQNSDVPAMKRTIKNLKWSLFLTSLTTFLAFSIFFLSPVGEIIDFALITCGGIVLSYFSTRYLFPKLILLVGVPPFSRNPPLERIKELLVKRLEKSRRTASIASGLVLLFGLISLTQSRVNKQPSFAEDANSPMGHAMRFFNTNFEGTRTIEVVLRDTNVLTQETMFIIDSIENHLLNKYQCQSVFSLNTAVKRLNRYSHFGKPSFYKVPDTLSTDFLNVINRYSNALGLQNSVSEDRRLLKIAGRLKETDLQTARARNQELAKFLKQFSTEKRSLFISGYSFVNDESQRRVTHYILLGVLMSLAIASILIWMVYCSFKLMVAVLIPNLLPLLSALCLMLVLGIELNAFSVMALSIILGLSVDDTIYFIGSSFTRGKKPSLEDITRGIRKNTFPVIVTSLLLSVGFGLLSFSEFSGNRDIGILVSLILLIALLSDLIVLPALMKWMFKLNRN